jgi:hypothetical protein
MFYENPAYAYVTDGDVRLMVCAPAVERGSLIGLLWSNENDYKELVALDLELILSWPFYVYTEDGRTGEMALTEMFPPANSLREWIPETGSGWQKLSDGRHYLRVSPKLAPIFGGSLEYCFLLYDALDNGVMHCSASELWQHFRKEPAEYLLQCISDAASEFHSLTRTLHQADENA